MAAEFAGKRALSELLSEILKEEKRQSSLSRGELQRRSCERKLGSRRALRHYRLRYTCSVPAPTDSQIVRPRSVRMVFAHSAGAKPIEQFFSMTACRCPEWKIYHFQLVQCSEPNNTSRLSEYAVGLTSGRCHDIRHSRMQRRTERCHHAHQPRGCCR